MLAVLALPLLMLAKSALKKALLNIFWIKTRVKGVDMDFKFKNNKTGESKTVSLDDSMIKMQMEDFAFDKLCDFEPVGESSAIKCNCDEYYEDFELQLR